MIDGLLKDSWVYKEWTQEATEKGIEQGAQQLFVSAIQARFASLVTLAKEKSALLRTPEHLQQLLVQVLQAHDEEEARRFLLADDNK